MTKHSPIKPGSSLLERAAELYDFDAAFRNSSRAVEKPVPDADVTKWPPAVATGRLEPAAAVQSTGQATTITPRAPVREKINRTRLMAQNFILPDGPVTGLSEEFRIVKRQLLLAARGGKGAKALPFGERILVCSANPNEGKTYCAINLALSMASEKDNRVLLVDADFAKPSILKTLAITDRPGFMDALANSDCDVEAMVIDTDINGLSILPAGTQTNQDTEYLAASRTAAVFDQLSRNDPSRIIIFDSSPALAASPASVLALHVGQILMVVHADVTTDVDLRDALNLLGGCNHVQLLLNRTKYSPTGRKFGSYYDKGATE